MKDKTEEKTKVELIKAWMPLLTAILSLLGTLFIGALQHKGQQSVNNIVTDINESLVTKLQLGLDKLYDTTIELRERVVVLETLLKYKYSKSKPAVGLASAGSDALGALAPMMTELPTKKRRVVELPMIQRQGD